MCSKKDHVFILDFRQKGVYVKMRVLHTEDYRNHAKNRDQVSTLDIATNKQALHRLLR